MGQKYRAWPPLRAVASGGRISERRKARDSARCLTSRGRASRGSELAAKSQRHASGEDSATLLARSPNPVPELTAIAYRPEA